MRVLVLPDKFKGSLTATQAAAAIARGVAAAIPDADVEALPVADGGEGFLDVFAAAGGILHEVNTVDAMGNPVGARWVETDGCAVLELADVIGLQQLASPSPATAWAASSRGIGVLVRAVLEQGFEEILIGVGGVATTDGGAGALLELGATMVDAKGNRLSEVRQLHRIAAVDLSGVDPRLRQASISIASDVLVPLTGPRGAAHAFAVQKGADIATVAALERRNARWAQALERAGGRVVSSFAGAGAAGGFPAGLAAVSGVTIRPGIEVIADTLRLRERLRCADLVIVGEGRLDPQSLEGKAPAAIARWAAEAGIPVLALVGATRLDPATAERAGIVRVLAIEDVAQSFSDAVSKAGTYLEQIARDAVLSPGRPRPISA